MRERVGAVHDADDAGEARAGVQSLDGKELPRQVRDVTEVQNTSVRRRDCLSRPLIQIVQDAGGPKTEICASMILSRRTRWSHVSASAIVLFGRWP